MNKQTNYLRKLLPAALLITAVAPANAFCPINFFPDPLFRPSFVSSQASIDAALTAFNARTRVSIQKNSDVVTAAIGVLTAQKALAASQIGKAIENNTQVQAQAQQSVETAKKLKEIEEEFGARSQGHEPCRVLAERQEVEKVKENTQKAIAQMINSEVTARPGRWASRRTALAERLALHDALYCTADQVSSGLCKRVGSRAGKSLEAATLFTPAPYDSAEYRDKSAFINNVMGLPDDPLDKNLASTSNGVELMDDKRRKDSINSTALAGFKYLQAAYSGVPNQHLSQANKELPVAKSEGDQLRQAAQTASGKNSAANTSYSSDGSYGSGVPLALQLKNDVSRYFGSGDEYKQWSKTLVGQTEKGVLKEILTIKALRLFQQSEKYQQLMQIEAMVAANVAAETYRNGMQANIENQRNRITRSNTAAAIKASQ